MMAFCCCARREWQHLIPFHERESLRRDGGGEKYDERKEKDVSPYSIYFSTTTALDGSFFSMPHTLTLARKKKVSRFFLFFPALHFPARKNGGHVAFIILILMLLNYVSHIRTESHLFICVYFKPSLLL